MVPDQGQSFVDASILMIGDGAQSADSTYGLLENCGLSVRMAESSAAAIRAAEMRPPDMVIIDRQAIPSGGVEICGQLCANPHFKNIPILLVGQPGDATLRAQTFKVGGADWLDAPIQQIELLTKVKMHLDLQRMRKRTGQLERKLADIQDRQEQTEQKTEEDRSHFDALIPSPTEELARAKEQAEAAVRAKNTFLSHMSHELRTPLNAILGFSRLMERNPNLTESQSENLRLIYQSGENLLRLINDVLNMSRIDTGNEKLESTVIDLPQLMQGVAVMFKSRAADQELTFSLDLAPNLPRFVRCDERKLQQILINLVSNSLKFTKTGGIDIIVRKSSEPPSDQTPRTRTEEGPCDLLFEVRDTGPGIAAENLERIFEPFFKARSSTTGNRGTGLGLTISQNFARLMGGGITAANGLNQGACFTFHVCLETAAAEEVRQEETPERIIGVAPGSKKIRVLVVDDDLTSRMLLSEILVDVGLDVEKAEDGEQAVELFSKWMPDIVFMDMRMPGMDGLTATGHIKATEKGRQTPVIALTGQAFEHQRQKILSAGCDGYLQKPLDEQQLFDVMGQHLEVTFIRENSRPAKSPPPENEAITIDAMAQLPVPLLKELRKIALELDMEKFKGHLDHIQSDQPALGAALAKLSNSFRFEEIFNLCDGALKAKG